MAIKTRLYHVEVYMPKGLMEYTKRVKAQIVNYEYSKHLRNQMKDEFDYKHYIENKTVFLNALKKISLDEYLPFEIESYFNREKHRFGISKYVVRVPYDETRDITIVVSPRGRYKGFIKTAWLNNKEDVHKTLDESKYCHLRNSNDVTLEYLKLIKEGKQ